MSVTAITTNPRYSHAREIPISRAELEKKLKLSRTQIFNLIKEGMPVEEHHPAGNRFLLSRCRTWLAARPADNVGDGYATTPTGGSYD